MYLYKITVFTSTEVILIIVLCATNKIFYLFKEKEIK